MSTAKSISVGQLSELQTSGAIDLIDVRSPVEFREVAASAARNVPLDRCNPHEIMSQRNCSVDHPLYLICKGGQRASKAQQKFLEAGYANVVNVEGGTDARVAAGMPVVRGKKAISLERQVRIVAGGLAAVGAFAALLTGNVLWATIPAFIGSGLVFAGVTDTCMMGELLARMPWIRTGAADGPTCS